MKNETYFSALLNQNLFQMFSKKNNAERERKRERVMIRCNEIQLG